MLIIVTITIISILLLLSWTQIQPNSNGIRESFTPFGSYNDYHEQTPGKLTQSHAFSPTKVRPSDTARMIRLMGFGKGGEPLSLNLTSCQRLLQEELKRESYTPVFNTTLLKKVIRIGCFFLVSPTVIERCRRNK